MEPETINGIFAIAGAIIGAVLAGLFAWLLQAKYRPRKEPKVLVARPKRLVDVDDSVKGMISVVVGGEEVETVTSVDYYILNTGNEVLSNIQLAIKFPTDVRILGGNCPATNFTTTTTEDFALHLDSNNDCEIQASFLNPGEEARGHLLLNNMPDAIDVHFRQPGVKLIIKKGYDSARTTMATEILYEAAKSNFTLDTYLKLALPAYRKLRSKNGI